MDIARSARGTLGIKSLLQHMARGVPIGESTVARHLLMQFADDPIAAHHLRSYCVQLCELSDLTRRTDQELMSMLADLVGDGRIRIGYLPPHDRMEGFAPKVEAPPAGEARAPAPAKKREAPASKAPAKEKCTNPACADAFSDAADNGTPLVTADAEGC